MTVHQALPLAAFVLNASLAGLSLARNPVASSHRLFSAFAAAMAVWNFGVFMLRRSPDAMTAAFWEHVIHVGVALLPAFYFHFVVSFVGERIRRRRAIALAYGSALTFVLADVGGSRLFLRGVASAYWGWAPSPGPLYALFIVYFNAYVVLGIVELRRALPRMESSTRRSRAKLIFLGSVVSLLGAVFDFGGPLGHIVPSLRHLYPLGIPANMAFALLLGTAIVRYRMFDVALTVKKAMLYTVLGAAVTGVLVVADPFVGPFWPALLAGTVITLLVTPLGRRVEEALERATGLQGRGCHDALLRLTRQMGTLVDVGTLARTLVDDLVRSVPVTHAVLLVREPSAPTFVTARMIAIDRDVPTPIVSADGPLATWLARLGGVVVKDDAEIDRRVPGDVVAELERLQGALLAPLVVDGVVTGILLLGEKTSGEVFSTAEIEVLGVLTQHAATALHNARLYERAQLAYAELAHAQRQLLAAQQTRARRSEARPEAEQAGA